MQNPLVSGYMVTRIDGQKVMEILYFMNADNQIYESEEHLIGNEFKAEKWSKSEKTSDWLSAEATPIGYYLHPEV